MDMDFNTPQQERGARTIGTAVAGGSTTPVRGNPSPLLPLVGTEARKARQAQRREARLAQRQLLREPAVGTPAAVEEPVAVEEAQPPCRKFFGDFLLSFQDCKLDFTTSQPFMGVAGRCSRPEYRN